MTEDDYQFWLRLPIWKASEAAALMLGLDPTAEHESIEYIRLREIFRRAKKAELLGDKPGPAEFIEFAKANRLSIATITSDNAAKIKPIRNWRNKYFSMKRKRDALAEELDDKLDSRERTTALTLIAILCQLRNEGPDKIGALRKVVQHKIDTSGLKLGKSTVAAWFKEADEFYSGSVRSDQ